MFPYKGIIILSNARKKPHFMCQLTLFFPLPISSKSANVLAVLGGVASEALDLTGFYYSGKPSIVKRKTNQPSRTGRY